MAQIRRKMKKVISFILVFLMVINSTTALGYSTLLAESDLDISGQLLKENVPLIANDSVSINDILTWRITVDKNKLEEGITITLPEGILPDITSGTLEGLTVEVNGNKVTVTSDGGGDSGVATGSAIEVDELLGLNNAVQVMSQDTVESASSGAVTPGDTQVLDIPCKIDQSKVENGQISIAGMDLNVTDMVQAGNMVTPDSIQLLKKEGGVVITSGATVSLYDEFVLRMTWESLENVKAGDYYELVLPKEFGVPSTDGSANMMASDVAVDFPKLPFATISWKAGSRTIHIEFQDMGKYTTGGVEYDALSLLGESYMDYECKLNETQSADEKGKITIKLLSDSVTITVGELVPKAPRLDKVAGTWNEQGEVEWTITYTHPVSSYTGDIPTKLVDTIPEGLVYVEDGTVVKVNDVKVDKTSWINNVDGNLICDLTNIQGGQTLTFTYKTKLTDKELQDIWTNRSPNQSYTNRIVAKVDNADAKGVEGNSTATVYSNRWSGKIMIKKDGKAIRPTDGKTDWTINWTVTVQTASRNFKNLTLIDTMGEGLILDPNSIKVVNEEGVNVSVINNVEPATGGKTQMTLDLVKAEVSKTSEKTYTITYTTTVKQEYFDQTSDLTNNSIENFAVLKYEWPDGSGISGTFSPPTVSKIPDEINNTMIEKSGKSYDAKDHSLLWEITVNPNEVNLTEVELIDDLTSLSPKHIFVPEGSKEETSADEIKSAVKKGMSDAGISSTVQDSVDVELVGNTLSIKMSKLGKNSFTFQLKTYATDPTFYAGNDSKTFNNIVTMTNKGTTVDGVPIYKDVSASATIYASSNVLTKEHVSYDPVTKKITWRLIVNSNETDLGDVIITDELVDGLSCNVDDAKINDKSFTEPNTFEVDGIKKNITINLSNVKSKQTITFTTTVDVDTEAFRTNTVVEFKNAAILKSKTNSDPVTSEKSLILTNKALDKKAIKNEQGLTADYTVKLNPLGMDLLKGLPTNQKLQLEDNLPDGLYLELDSVKLYNAGVLETTRSYNTYTVELKPVGEAIDTAISYDPSSRKLTVDIPDATKGYVLTYRTYIVRTGVNLTNDIQLVGSVLPDNNSIKDSSFTTSVASNGNAKMVLPPNKFVSLQIKKVNESGNILTGASFGLYVNKTDITPLVSATCDSATGICTLAVPKGLVKGSQKLYWKEITSPNGYELSTEWHEVDVTNYNPEMIINVVNVKAGDAVSAQIKLKKTDLKDSSKVLSDAVFALYADEECTLPVKEDGKPLISTSGSNGVITFTGLYPEQTYYVREVSAPKGYILSEQTKPVVAKKAWADSDIISVTNEKADVTLHVTKVDARDLTKKLSGAEFQLYEDESCTIKVGEAQTTIADGTLSFTGLFPYSTYYLREITAPENYNITTDIITITTGANGVPVAKQVGNYLIGWNEKASIKITKTNEDGTKLLSGASFALYEQDKATLIGEQSTDGDGVCSFTGLGQGTYYVRETAAPEGYLLSDDWMEVSLDVNEAVQRTITNYLIGWNEKASIKIIKTNEDGTKLLSGASFALYEQDKATLIGEQSTDGDGVCSFTGLGQGTYYVRETAAPEGYLLSDDWIEVSLDVNEAVQRTITNAKIPPVKPTEPTNPTNPTNPTEPTNPTNPTEPTNPTNPTNPTEPTNPTDPVKPQEPEKPEDGSESNGGKDNEIPNNSKNGKDDGGKDKSDLNQKGGNNRDSDQKDSQKISNDSLPKTGVKSHYVLWIACIMLSFVTAIGLVVFWKRQNKRMNVKQIVSKKDKSSDQFK